MAIIKCPECGHDVSDKAPVCLYCGVEIAGKYMARPSTPPRQQSTYSHPVNPQPTPISQPRTQPTYNDKPTTNATQQAPSSSSAVGTPIGNGAYGDPVQKPKPKMGHFLIYLILFLILLIIGVVTYNFLTDNKNDVSNEESEYEYVMNCDDAARMKSYLDTFGSAPRAHRDSVQARLSQISKSQREWDDVLTSNSRNAFKKYIEDNPSSPYVNIARHKIDSIDWAHARSEDTDEAYSLYLREHPEGEHTADARRHADTAKEPETEPEPEVQPEQPAAPQPAADLAVSDIEKKRVDDTVTRLFVAINKKLPEPIAEVVSPQMTKFLTKDNATKSDVIGFMNKLWGDDIKNLNWRIDHNSMAVNKRQVGEGRFEYTADFGATLSKRSKENKDTSNAYKVKVNINKDGKISAITMTKTN